MLRVNNLTKSYHEVLFEDISFMLGNKEKVGLVGFNGSGKTTLLRILAGIEIPDKGSIELTNESIAYLPQEFDFEGYTYVGEFLESLIDDIYQEMFKVDRILSRLNMLGIDHYREIASLSEGQKIKLYLTKILISDPTILLLDEPTNHLDLDGIIEFESFVKNFKGIVIIISHDRAFLNNTVDHIYEIDEQQLYIYEGNYDGFIEGKAARLEQRAKELTLQEKKRAQLEKLLENVHKIRDGKKRGRAIRAAQKRMVREVLANEIDEYKNVGIKDLEVKGNVHNQKKILELKNLSFSYDKKHDLLVDSSLVIYGKEKVWMYGSNGIGKTTLIKLVINQLKPASGEVKMGENINWCYFSQNQTHLPMESTVEDFFINAAGVPYESSFGALEKFMFPKTLRKHKLRNLSPGQRARLSFAVFHKVSMNFSYLMSLQIILI